MSLKAFHVVFIIVSTAFTVFFGIWGIRHYMHYGDNASLAMGIGAFIAGGLLYWYFRWFLRKLKDVSYL